jgi:hypothetical protein
MEKESYKFTEEEVDKLIHLFLKRFVDIPKILNSLDSDLAQSFKKRNGAYYQALLEEGKIHQHHEEGDMCDEMHSSIFIPDSDQNTVEKLIAHEIYPPRFKLNLITVLEETHESYNKILLKIKDKVDKGEGPDTFLPNLPGIEKPKELVFDEDECKQIMKKITYESINRFVREKVKFQLIEKEKSYAQQPMLLAFPNSAPKNSDISQISAENFGKFMTQGYCVQKSFIDLYKTENVYSELLQCQREGRFQDIRTMQNMMNKTRTDQVLKFNYTQLGDEKEVGHLKQICERLSWIPYECNLYFLSSIFEFVI